ncbi:MAG: hypothetical protein PHR06_12020, partial [Candidatus Cloacimonetes bacterium]|nr:hypothetical protein [Candidatus Cloacimonadota bacterium]
KRKTRHLVKIQLLQAFRLVVQIVRVQIVREEMREVLDLTIDTKKKGISIKRQNLLSQNNANHIQIQVQNSPQKRHNTLGTNDHHMTKHLKAEELSEELIPETKEALNRFLNRATIKIKCLTSKQ